MIVLLPILRISCYCDCLQRYLLCISYSIWKQILYELLSNLQKLGEDPRVISSSFKVQFRHENDYIYNGNG
jgi:hypothetical protein